MSAVRSRMTMSAHVQRDGVSAARDSWNSPVPQAWDGLDDTVPCYAWALLGSTDAVKEVDERKVAVVERFRMMTPLGSGLTNADRVLKITNRRDEVVFNGPFTIDVGRNMPSHAEWDLAKGRPI